MKKLYKSRENKVWRGLIGGIGEYFEVDPSILRVIWIFFCPFTAFIPGIFAYLFSCAVVPKHPDVKEK